MAAKIFTSPEQIKRKNNLLKKDTPSYRQAYSDRTAWIMACLSELAYLKFNPLLPHGKNAHYIAQKATEFLDEAKKSSLIKLIDLFGYDHEAEKEQLEGEVKMIGIELCETFDKEGTQAILVKSKKFIALAFRGTEKESITDIKADAKAMTTACESGGKIHSGFNEAFEPVALDIQNTLDTPEYSDLPLFITGHSLGGALATVATKKLNHEGGIAACYTFGSPRVGDDDWIATIKDPIYRVVNAADCVTMLPPGDIIISVVAWVCRGLEKTPLPYTDLLGKCSSTLLSKFGGYMHSGDMRYLTNCSKDNYADVKLLPAVGLGRRIKGLMTRIGSLVFKKFLTDHSIRIYRKQLMIIAENRNK